MSGDSDFRQCPTRRDDRPALVAHEITTPMCHKRQRERYHKCYTCAHYDRAGSTSIVKLPSLRPPGRSGLIAS